MNGKQKFWAAAAAMVLVALLWKWWKRRPLVADGVAWNPDTGASEPGASYYTQQGSTNPDNYAVETIDYLNTQTYVSPTHGPTSEPLYNAYLAIRAATPEARRDSNPAFADVIRQMEEAIKIHFPNSILR